jgi:two-component system osmolarity sensor histidine kinase EnvZ
LTPRPRSLFGRTAITIALSLLFFVIISLGATVYFVAIPMAQRSADDFSALIIASAESFQSAPDDEREEMQDHLLQDHGLIATTQTPALSEKTFDLPYYLFFRAALARRTGEEISIIEAASGPVLWVDIPVEESIVRMGFDRGRVGTNPPLVVILVIVGGVVLTMLTSFLVVHRVTTPLTRLSEAVREVGRGQRPPKLAEDGPEELATLARAFNQMSSDLQDLLENRTVIVAGISHDLRTPLTRLGLAVEMLNQDSDPQLVAEIRRDLASMERMIGQFLQFSRGLGDTQLETIALGQVLEAQVNNLRRQGRDVQLNSCAPCPYLADPDALERVLANLMENAAYYGDGEPIEVDMRCDDQSILIRISDRGPGIPPDQLEAVFRPFHRLESARSHKTGGSGLGLAIARQLADKHGWKIKLGPRGGGGTVAELELPIAQ